MAAPATSLAWVPADPWPATSPSAARPARSAGRPVPGWPGVAQRRPAGGATPGPRLRVPACGAQLPGDRRDARVHRRPFRLPVNRTSTPSQLGAAAGCLRPGAAPAHCRNTRHGAPIPKRRLVRAASMVQLDWPGPGHQVVAALRRARPRRGTPARAACCRPGDAGQVVASEQHRHPQLARQPRRRVQRVGQNQIHARGVSPWIRGASPGTACASPGVAVRASSHRSHLPRARSTHAAHEPSEERTSRSSSSSVSGSRPAGIRAGARRGVLILVEAVHGRGVHAVVRGSACQPVGEARIPARTAGSRRGCRCWPASGPGQGPTRRHPGPGPRRWPRRPSRSPGPPATAVFQARPVPLVLAHHPVQGHAGLGPDHPGQRDQVLGDLRVALVRRR